MATVVSMQCEKSREEYTENYCLSWFLFVVVTSTALYAAKTLRVKQTVTATVLHLLH